MHTAEIKRHIRVAALAAMMAVAAFGATAAPIDEARKLYYDGDYTAAIDLLEPIVKKSPRDGNANYYLGASLFRTGDIDASIAPLTVAESRGIADASRWLAEAALRRYAVDDADEHLDRWESQLRKQRKKEMPDELGQMQSRSVKIRNMLERVERIEIIDSVKVSAERFFEAYPLSAEAGSLSGGEVLPPSLAAESDDIVVYTPESRREMIWAGPDSTNTLVLTAAAILDDGTIDHPTVLRGDGINGGGNAAYPFLMPDGVTLYYANNGEESLGGYDIFLTRRTDDGTLLQPQNVGMPYNSPYNDYMLAIDESTGAGWWATDRNSDDGLVTIYTFIPSDMRVNYDVDDPDIVKRALVTSISDTWQEGTDRQTVLDAVARASAGRNNAGDHNKGESFELAMGNGKVYHSLRDFANPAAVNMMHQLLAAQQERRTLAERMARLREAYRSGNRDVQAEILDGEQRLTALDRDIATLRNSVIRLEQEQ